MSWAVFYEGDFLFIRSAITSGALIIENGANQIHDLNIRFAR